MCDKNKVIMHLVAQWCLNSVYRNKIDEDLNTGLGYIDIDITERINKLVESYENDVAAFRNSVAFANEKWAEVMEKYAKLYDKYIELKEKE